MFAKLLKYDMRALKKSGVPILISLLAVTVLASILGFFAVSYLDRSVGTSEFADVMYGLVTMLLMFGGFFVMILFTMASTVMLVLVCVHFYKNTVSDEGYLTFTLPVTSNQIIYSKTLSGFIWTVVIAVASIVGMCIVFFTSMLGASEVAGALGEAGEMLPDVYKELIMAELNAAAVGIIILIVQAVIVGIITIVFNLVLTYMSIFLGGVIAKKHKGLAAIGCVFGANAVLRIISSIFSMVLLPLMFTVNTFGDMITSYNITLFASILFYGGAGVGCFFILKHMMDKKLNLN